MTNATALHGQNNPMGSDATKHDVVGRMSDFLDACDYRTSHRHTKPDDAGWTTMKVRNADGRMEMVLPGDVQTMLDLINTQSAEIERLKAEAAGLRAGDDYLSRVCSIIDEAAKPVLDENKRLRTTIKRALDQAAKPLLETSLRDVTAILAEAADNGG